MTVATVHPSRAVIKERGAARSVSFPFQTACRFDTVHENGKAEPSLPAR